jgi:hypothetical protein
MCQIPWEGWTAIATGVLAVATIALVIVAWRGLAAWRETLRHDRIDGTVSAARDLEGELGRAIDAKAHHRDEPFIRDLWDAWRRFDRTFYVVRRYHHELSPNLSADVAEQIRQLGLAFREGMNWERAGQIQQEIQNLLGPIYRL